MCWSLQNGLRSLYSRQWVIKALEPKEEYVRIFASWTITSIWVVGRGWEVLIDGKNYWIEPKRWRRIKRGFVFVTLDDMLLQAWHGTWRSSGFILRLDSRPIPEPCIPPEKLMDWYVLMCCQCLYICQSRFSRHKQGGTFRVTKCQDYLKIISHQQLAADDSDGGDRIHSPSNTAILKIPLASLFDFTSNELASKCNRYTRIGYDEELEL